MVEMAEGKPVSLPISEEDGFQITGDLIREHATDNTKLVILNSPANPTGGVLTRKSVKSIAEAAMELDLYILSDEIYEMLHYLDRNPKSIASLPGMMHRTVTANGFSKAYAMTGWRVGYIVAPPPILSAMNKVQQHTLTCTSSVAQYAALAAVTGPHAPVQAMTQMFRKRRDFLVEGINSIEGLHCRTPEGAFYCFFSYDLDMPSLELAKKLLELEGIALTPGAAFGSRGEGYMRFSYAASMELLQEGVERLAKGYSKLRFENSIRK
jgi:aspartate/methionine/tyrosine aminotransferase